MNDFRKNMYVAYKERMVNIISQCIDDMARDGRSEEIEDYADLHQYIFDWVNSNCLPMGDFDKEKALKEIEEWSK